MDSRLSGIVQPFLHYYQILACDPLKEDLERTLKAIDGLNLLVAHHEIAMRAHERVADAYVQSSARYTNTGDVVHACTLAARDALRFMVEEHRWTLAELAAKADELVKQIEEREAQRSASVASTLTMPTPIPPTQPEASVKVSPNP